MLIPISACVGLAALSLLLPSEPSYDPWAWLVWGWEIAHLELDTEGGPSWKPLPVALLAPATTLGGDLPVALWVVIARAGALLAMVLAYRLAERLTGGPAPLRAVAGATATVFLVLTPDWFQLAAHASEAPMAVALMLWWVVPEWIGSGDPLNGGSQARSEPYWSLSHAERPWLRALERVHNHAGLAVELLAAAAVVAAVAFGRWAVPAGAAALRQRAVLALAAAAALEATL